VLHALKLCTIAATADPLTVCKLCIPERSSPLKGYGTPGPDTTEIYVSAYLDRLLNGASPVPATLHGAR
jgi:hypothetical protein